MSPLETGEESRRTGRPQAKRKFLKLEETPCDATARNTTLTVLYILN